MTSDRSSGDFGSKLRETRERRGITLRQIAIATKISVGALEALERNDISRLPGGIFSRAFVRSYANQVGLDPEQAVQDFIAAFPHDSVTAGHPRSDRIEDNEALESDRQTASTFLRLIVLSIPLAGVVVYFSTSGRLSSGASTPVPPAVAAGRPAVSTPQAVADPKPAANPERTPPAPSAVDPAVTGAAATGPMSVAPNAAPNAAPTSAAGTAGAVRANADRAPASSQAGDPTLRGADDVPLTVVLSVTRPCWLSATVDGRKLIERLLQSGEEQSVEVIRELELTAGDATAVRMTINGVAARPFGKTGQVITVRVNPANFKSYLASR